MAAGLSKAQRKDMSRCQRTVKDAGKTCKFHDILVQNSKISKEELSKQSFHSLSQKVCMYFLGCGMPYLPRRE